jgi:hypothetical protein
MSEVNTMTPADTALPLVAIERGEALSSKTNFRPRPFSMSGPMMTWNRRSMELALALLTFPAVNWLRVIWK